MPKHTPLPWSNYKGQIIGPSGQVIVEEMSSDVSIPKAEAAANADAIVAAMNATEAKALLKKLAKHKQAGNPGDRSEFARGYKACARSFAAAIDAAFSADPGEAMKRHFE